MKEKQKEEFVIVSANVMIKVNKVRDGIVVGEGQLGPYPFYRDKWDVLGDEIRKTFDEAIKGSNLEEVFCGKFDKKEA